MSFTDVFPRRDGRWRAVSTQETLQPAIGVVDPPRCYRARGFACSQASTSAAFRSGGKTG